MGTVVLFNHPGKEHVVRRDGARYVWHTGSHRRKYLSVRARVAFAYGDGFRREDAAHRVALWGEFEADTVGHRFRELGGPGLPESWHTLVPVGTAPAGGKNTDPWIFGVTFRYAYCKQSTVDYLKRLSPGDLLLFGSYIARHHADGQRGLYDFYLDTVFVVNQVTPPSASLGHPGSLFDPVHKRASYDRLPKEGRRSRDLCSFYTGVMLDERLSRLPFSFSPCVVSEERSPRRMKRPCISDLFDWTTSNPQVFKRLECRDTSEDWHKVTERCVNEGCALAVWVEEATLDPAAKESDASPSTCD